MCTSTRFPAHFGHWLEVRRRGCKVLRWQVAIGLIYGQVKKCYRRRKLVRVTHVMRLGTGDALKAALQGLGFSGRLNTAFIERVNLTVRHGVSALARRTWATSQQAPQLLAHVQWWPSVLPFCASSCIAAGSAHADSRTRGQTIGATRPPAYAGDGSWENQPTMDGAGGALLPLAAGFRLRGTKARCECSAMLRGDG